MGPSDNQRSGKLISGLTRNGTITLRMSNGLIGTSNRMLPRWQHHLPLSDIFRWVTMHGTLPRHGRRTVFDRLIFFSTPVATPTHFTGTAHSIANPLQHKSAAIALLPTRRTRPPPVQSLTHVPVTDPPGPQSISKKQKSGKMYWSTPRNLF